MHPSDRVVVSLPLAELWKESGPVPARRERWLGREHIRSLLRAGPVWFVVADCGAKLRWVAPAESFALWKSDVRDHVCAGDAWSLEDYSGEYCYVASEWRLASGETAVVLEKSH